MERPQHPSTTGVPPEDAPMTRDKKPTKRPPKRKPSATAEPSKTSRKGSTRRDGRLQRGGDEPVPPVDHELLQTLVRGELSEAESRKVYRWIYTNPAWEDAHNRLLLKALRPGKQE